MSVKILSDISDTCDIWTHFHIKSNKAEKRGQTITNHLHHLFQKTSWNAAIMNEVQSTVQYAKHRPATSMIHPHRCFDMCVQAAPDWHTKIISVKQSLLLNEQQRRNHILYQKYFNRLFLLENSLALKNVKDTKTS